MKTKNLIVICITLLIVGILFYPTLYRYEKTSVEGNTFPVRINRVTGYTEYFVLGTWNPEKGQKKKAKGSKLPYDARLKITGNASLRYGDFSGKIYNGSDWTITSITFRVEAKEKDGIVRWDRKFKKSIKIEPLSTSSFSITVTGDEGIGSHVWYIDEIIGYKSKN